MKLFRLFFCVFVTVLLLAVSGCRQEKPEAAFTTEPTSGAAPLKVKFTDASTIVKKSEIAEWLWDFGDGATSTEQHPEHTYAAVGEYTVSLTVTSSDGKTDTSTLAKHIKVRVAVPSVVGLPYADAKDVVRAADLTVGTMTEAFSATVPAGAVNSQDPAAGAVVSPGSPVNLVVSRGPQPVTVPNVVGMTQAAAEAAITAATLVPGTVIRQSSDTVPEGSVIRQNPSAGASVGSGTAVALAVSSGPFPSETTTIYLPGGVPLELVKVPAGSFQMGSPATERSRWGDEGPVHTVDIGYDFFMGRHEVTQEQWLAVMGSWPGDAPSPSLGEGGAYPAYNISWEDAQAFIAALNAHIAVDGQCAATLRLPSESEWEYACRAGTKTRFHFGDSLEAGDVCENDDDRDAHMWYCGNNAGAGEPGYGTKPVGGKLPNAFGLYDMSGNLLEWCEDFWHNDYTGAPADGSAWTRNPSASYRVVRGGNWANGAQHCRSAYRKSESPTYRFNITGFRLAAGDLEAATTVPDLAGMMLPAARTAITEAVLTVGTVTEVFSADVPAGNVIGQSPAGGESVPVGRAVNLVVSGGAEPVTTPDVTGMLRAEAEAVLTEATLAVGTVTETFSAMHPAGTVLGQDPAAGVGVPSGTPVNLVVSSGPGDGVAIQLPGGVPLELVKVPAGSFQMGSPDTERGRESAEGPLHAVNIGYNFYMGRHEVTQAQWLAVMGSWPGDAPLSSLGSGGAYPAYGISWEDVQAFIGAVNGHIAATGQGDVLLRLPSESEWEYACRAGAQTRFYFGDSLAVDDVCENDGERSTHMWYCGNNAPNGIKPAARSLPNAFGLHDMSGNLWEWCEDWQHGDYTGAPAEGSAWVRNPSAPQRIIRGGSWGSNARHCRSAHRYSYSPSYRSSYIGFRLAADDMESMVPVPLVTGMPVADAEAAIAAAPLIVGTVAEVFSDTVPAGYVISQNPAAGVEILAGRAVNLVVSRGPFDGETEEVLLPGDVPLELVKVPAGGFQMGSPATEQGHSPWEGPVHQVNIGYDFYMGAHEVTQAQWLAVMGAWPGAAPTSSDGQGDAYPAYNVSWQDAKAFITALNAHLAATAQGTVRFRLPSESEWEYACRGGTQTRFYFGDSLDAGDECEDDGERGLYMWYCGNNADDGEPGYGSKPVGGKLPNAFGLYDMSGNVWEWCEDWWHNDYTGAPASGSAWVSPPTSNRVVRGGWWQYAARYCRSADRNAGPPENRYHSVGFRLAADPVGPVVLVPDVTGMPQAAAEEAIVTATLTVEAVSQEYSDTVPAGSVIRQNPLAGTSVPPGTAVYLVVSAGVAPITVPPVVGLTQAAAETAITTATLTVGTVAYAYSETVPAGRVTAQDPAAGTGVSAGTAVNIVVSLGSVDPATLTILLPGDVPLELVKVLAGSFQMGSPDTERSRWVYEGPVHEVTIGHNFYMGVHEVTQAQWLALMSSWPGAAPSSPLGLGDAYPAYNVSWEDAQAFVTALNAHIAATGQGPVTVRLPSESEWEYACRAGSQTRFHFGDSLGVGDACEDDGVRSRYMWYCGNANGSSQPVGTKLPNAFGLHDTSGNVWEWCEDWWHGDYTGAPTDGSEWILNPDEPFRILRGGSWDHYAQYCRSALRDGVSPSMRDADVGFRIAGDR